MSRISFENYGRRAERPGSFAEIAGRYKFQSGLEKNIVRDVSAKLDLRPDDDLIEIGCGAGNILISLAKKVRNAAGVDHPSLLEKLRRRPGGRIIKEYPGNFLDIRIPARYSKVLVYSVIHYLSSMREVHAFLDKAASLLRPGGILLVGDIPNADRKRRFRESPLGRKIDREWARRVKRASPASPNGLPKDPKAVALGDRGLLGLLARFRAKGFEAFILPEPEDLCFAYTREDILIKKSP